MIIAHNLAKALAKLEKEYDYDLNRVETQGNGEISHIVVLHRKDYGFCYDDREEGLVFILCGFNEAQKYKNDTGFLRIITLEDDADRG